MGNSGDGLRLASSAGGYLDDNVHQPAAWAPVSLVPQGDGTTVPYPHFYERGKPGYIAVDRRGRRFTNEAQSYHVFVPAMIEACRSDDTVEAWIVCDHRAIRKFGLGALGPRPLPIGPHLKSGYIMRGKSIEELARAIGIDPANLAETIASYNRSAVRGEDPAFNRGSDSYQRFNGAAGHAPNPCVAPLDQGPFYAVRGLAGRTRHVRGHRHGRIQPRDRPRRPTHRRALRRRQRCRQRDGRHLSGRRHHHRSRHDLRLHRRTPRGRCLCLIEGRNNAVTKEENDMTLTRRSSLAAMAAVGLALSSAAALAQEKEIRIGALMSTSGPAAFLGVSEKNAFDMIIEQMNAAGGMSGYKIKPFFYDTEGNSTIAAQQFRRLIETDQVHAVIGPSTTGESLAIRPIANEMKVPLISMAGAEAVVTPPTPFVFKTPPTDRIVAEHVLGFMKSKGMQTVAILSSADAYGQAGAAVIKEVAGPLGMKVAAAEEFGPRDADMTPQVLRIRSSGADAMLIWSVNPGPTIILKNATAVGYTKPIFNSYGAATPQLIEQAGAAAEKSYVSSMRLLAPDSLAADDPMRAVVAKLAKDYKDRFKADATTFVAHSHDALVLIDLAMKKIGGAPDRVKIADAIRTGGIKFPGANGMFNFTPTNHNGLDRDSQSVVMLQVQGGKFVVVK